MFYLGKIRIGAVERTRKKANTVGGELTEVLASLSEIVAMFLAGSILCVYRCEGNKAALGEGRREGGGERGRGVIKRGERGEGRFCERK